MNVKLLTVLLMLLFAKAQVGFSAEGEDVNRMVIYPNESHYYKVKGESFFYFPDKFDVTDTVFGSGVAPESVVNAHELNFNPGVPIGFTHPSYLGFKEGEEKTYSIKQSSIGKFKQNGFLEPSPLPFVGKAKWTKSSWKYELETPDEIDGDIYLKLNIEDESFFALIKTCELDISTSFDQNKGRVSSTTIKYKWTLDKPYEPKEPINESKKGKKKKVVSSEVLQSKLKREKIIKNWKGKFSRSVTVRYGGINKIDIKKEKGKGREVVSDPRHAKAIDLGKKHLWDKIKQESSWQPSVSGKIKNSPQRLVGSLGLAFFALLRADEDPNDPQMERYLLKYCEHARNAGYTKTNKKVDKCGYAAGCALMMIEAALNSNDTDGTIVKKGGREQVSKNFRGSKRLQTELLELADVCVFLLNAQGGPAKYGQKDENTQRGHLWAYNGTRGFTGTGSASPHYSPAQYAVLGLRCAKLIGVDVADNVWEDIHKGVIEDFQVLGNTALKVPKDIISAANNSTLEMEFEDGIVRKGYRMTQRGVGLWGYRREETSHGYANFNMVCAALGNLAMAYNFAPDKARPEMKDQIGMGLHYCQLVLENLYENLSYYDYYSWERVAVFYGVKTVKGKNWHHDMSEKICDAQNMSTGEFNISFTLDTDHSSKAPLMATAYAVLFLKKATKKLGYTIGGLK